MDAETILDATTQPGFAGKPIIYLDGQLIANVGLRLYADSDTVRGFAINHFNIGIYCTARDNIVEGCYVGTDLTGAGSAGYQNINAVLRYYNGWPPACDLGTANCCNKGDPDYVEHVRSLIASGKGHMQDWLDCLTGAGFARPSP